MTLKEKQLKIVEETEKDIANFTGGAYELKDLQQYLHIQKKVLHRLGYRKPRTKTVQQPPKINPFKLQEKEVPELLPATEEEKKGPKFNKYLNKEKKAAIKKLFFEGTAAAEISAVLWIEKRQIDKYLKTLKADKNRNLIADNSTKKEVI